jgi:hypothetical protein
MADKHPYIPASGYLVKVISQFRRSFPAQVTADTLKKLGIAPKNESYLLNIVRFLGLIDQEGNRTEVAQKIFTQADDAKFSQEFEKLVRKAYDGLFELHGKENAWNLDSNTLISYFRSSDQTTDTVGKLQASTFQVLAAYAGHGDVPAGRGTASKASTSNAKGKGAKPGRTAAKEAKVSPVTKNELGRRISNLGLSVRIEVNLPADGNQETYDRIFRSIRENLLDV